MVAQSYYVKKDDMAHDWPRECRFKSTFQVDREVLLPKAQQTPAVVI